MKKILLIIVLLFLSVQIGYCQEEKQPLQLIIKSDKEAYKRGEQIKLSVGIKNNSNKDISIYIFDIEHKLMENLSFFDEGYPPNDGKFYTVTFSVFPCKYTLKDWTKRKLPIVTPEDFIFLKPQEEYGIALIVDTVIPADSSWRYIYEKKSDWEWGEGFKELPARRKYQITAKYENSIVGLGERGVAIHKDWRQPNVLLALHNIWTGVITSNTIAIEVTENKALTNKKRHESLSGAPRPFNQRIDTLIKKYKNSNPEEDAQTAFKNNDLRFMGVGGYALLVPGVNDYSMVYQIPETSDVIMSEKHFQFQAIAKDYAVRYNKEMLKLIEDTPLKLTLWSDKEAYELTETIKIKVVMKNIANKEIIIWHAGFWANHKVMLVDENKKNVPLTDFGKRCKEIFNQSARDKNVRWPLAPGQEDKYEFELNKLYSLGSSGIYYLAVIYEENWVDGWAGTATSNTIAINIKEKTADLLLWSNKAPYPYQDTNSLLVANSYKEKWVESSAEKYPVAVQKAKEVLKNWGRNPEEYEYKGSQYRYKIFVSESSNFISVIFAPIGLAGLEQHVEIKMTKKDFVIVSILPGA